MTDIPLFYDPALICECCGHASPNQYTHDLNHYIFDGVCVSQRLRSQHKENQ